MHWIFLWLLGWFDLSFAATVYKWIYILLKTLPRDVWYFMTLFKVYTWINKRQKQDITIFKELSNIAKKNPTKVAFYCDDEAWTFQKVEAFSNQVANYFELEGYKKGDSIALVLDNCIEYPSIWLGLSKLGVVTALINTNIVKDGFLHAIKAANCKAIIFGTNHAETIHEVMENLQVKKLYQFRSHFDEEHEQLMESVDVFQEINSMSETIDRPKDVSINDRLLYIYTSGTTGFPKAALVTHLKFAYIVRYLREISGVTEHDVLYTTTPIYHSIGGMVGIGMALIGGSTVAIGRRFSALNFFKNCSKYNVTVAQYVGELCRYVLAVPEDQDVKHKVRTILGNGLKPQIWKKFVDRFGIHRVVELYGSTEGNAFFVNVDGTVGAVGFIPRYLKWALGTTNIKCHESTGEPIRNEDGFCVECGVGEAGILITKIKTKTLMNYDGYTDKQATEKKLLRNVFRKGDMYFNTGDVLEFDEFGYCYFKDRTGDTFRWKGENVSTSEIEAIISNIVNLNDVAVYGVKIPNSDGRAGMAAIVDQNGDLDISSLGYSFKESLPNYAIPIFLRIMDSVPLTGTFKIKKVELRDEGYDINKIKDKMYFYDSRAGKYLLLTNELNEKIENGKLRI